MKRALFLALLLTACTPSGSPTTSTTEPPATTGTTTPAATTGSSAPATTTTGAGCGGETTADGPVVAPDSAGSDAEQLAAITWETDSRCERFTLEFTSAEGAPATTHPFLEADFFRSFSVLRVYTSVEVTAVTDQLVQSALVDRAYVVRSSHRDLFVDFHLSSPALAGIEVSGGNIVVTLEPGGSDLGAAGSFGDNVVVVTPSPGNVDVPFTVSGYSRNFEANTVVQVTQDGALVAEETTTATDWVETWGEFELTIAPDGSGPAELFVGEFSAQDGSPRGLVLDIEY